MVRRKHSFSDDDPSLQRDWARKLLEAWRYYNWMYLGDALRPPVIEIARGESVLGHWNVHTRTLAIAAEHVRKDPWAGVLETLSSRPLVRYNSDDDFDETERLVPGAPVYSPFVRHVTDAVPQ